MTKPDIADVAGRVVKLLQPFSSEDRQRVVSASLTLLGETSGPGSQIDRPNNQSGHSAAVGTRARTWMRQNSLSAADIEQAFHVENGQAEVIISDIPGKDKREKTRNAYVLTGVANLLVQDSPAFADEAARTLCVSAGCFDSGNHATALKAKGNLFSGSKGSGWTVTAPGLKHAATLIKGLSQ